MDFAFTPEQEELRDQARDFLAAHPEPSWQELAELGWTGVSVRRSTAAPASGSSRKRSCSRRWAARSRTRPTGRPWP